MIADLYRETVMDHYRYPRSRRRLADPTLAHTGENPFCGDRIELTLRLSEERIIEIGFHGAGCAVSQASASMMCEQLEGANLSDAERSIGRFVEAIETGSEDYSEELGDAAALVGVRRFPVRAKCALLAWLTLREAIGLFRQSKLPRAS